MKVRKCLNPLSKYNSGKKKSFEYKQKLEQGGAELD